MSWSRADKARLVLKMGENMDRAFWAAKGAFDGLVLALLDRSMLHEIDKAYFDGKGQYFDADYNAQGFWPWEQEAVDRWFAGRSPIVVTAAGGGREVLALQRQGLEAVGFECHSGMVDVGNRFLVEQGQAELLNPCERDGWPSPGGKYSGAIIGWGSYHHIRGRHARIEMLRGARAALSDGSPILLSFFVRTEPRYSRWVYGVARRVGRWGRGEPVEMGDGMTPHYAHHFTRAEIQAELSSAGFEMVHFATESYGRAVGVATHLGTGSQ